MRRVVCREQHWRLLQLSNVSGAAWYGDVMFIAAGAYTGVPSPQPSSRLASSRIVLLLYALTELNDERVSLWKIPACIGLRSGTE